MKNYLAFTWKDEKPDGGMDDFISDYDTLEEAVQAIKQHAQEDYDTCVLKYMATNWCGQVWSQNERKEVYRRNITWNNQVEEFYL